MQIKLFKPIGKNKQYIGILKSFDENNIILDLEKDNITFERKDISQIKTVYDW